MKSACSKAFSLLALSVIVSVGHVTAAQAQEYDVPSEVAGTGYSVALNTQSDNTNAETVMTNTSVVAPGLSAAAAASAGTGIASAPGLNGVRAVHIRGTYALPTNKQSAASLPTGLGVVSPIYGTVGYNRLPPTIVDSFVRSAGASADLIYGDEGTDGPPPYSQFTQIHRIESGIYGDTSKGLTTGHRSKLPSAWGADEFLGAEWYELPALSAPAK